MITKPNYVPAVVRRHRTSTNCVPYATGRFLAGRPTCGCCGSTVRITESLAVVWSCACVRRDKCPKCVRCGGHCRCQTGVGKLKQ